MKTNELVAEHHESLRQLTREHADFLIGLGISPFLISVYQMIGVVRAARAPDNRNLWVPDKAGKYAFVTPVRVHDPLTPQAPNPWETVRLGEIVDLVAWTPSYPDCLLLRTGEADWLGARTLQQIDPFPPHLRSDVLSWLRADAEGVVLLSHHPFKVSRALSGLGNTVIVETEAERHRLATAIEQRRRSLIPQLIVSGGSTK